MMHIAAKVVLHIMPLSSIRVVQHFDCEPKKGAGHVFVRPADVSEQYRSAGVRWSSY